MPRVVVTPATFPRAVRQLLAQRQRLLERAAMNAAQRGAAEAVRLTDAAGLVDVGTYKRSFLVRRTANGAEITNRSPHAGVIEYGRRKGSRPPPVAVIELWARRKLRLPPAEARRAAFAIARNIGRRGLRPHFIMRRAARAAQGWFRDEIRVALKRGIDLLAP